MWAETLVRGLDLKSDAKGLAAMVLERKNKSTRESTSDQTPKAADKNVRPDGFQNLTKLTSEA